MNSLDDSDIQSFSLNDSQMTNNGFEKIAKADEIRSRADAKAKSAMRSQVLNQGRVYEA